MTAFHASHVASTLTRMSYIISLYCISYVHQSLKHCFQVIHTPMYQFVYLSMSFHPSVCSELHVCPFLFSFLNALLKKMCQFQFIHVSSLGHILCSDTRYMFFQTRCMDVFQMIHPVQECTFIKYRKRCMNCQRQTQYRCHKSSVTS